MTITQDEEPTRRQVQRDIDIMREAHAAEAKRGSGGGSTQP